MDVNKLVDYYKEKNQSRESIIIAKETIRNFNTFCQKNRIYEIGVKEIDNFINHLINESLNSVEALLAIARYFYISNDQENYIHISKYLGGMGVVENIKDRIEKFVGKEKSVKIFHSLEKPVIGTSPEDIVYHTDRLIKNIEKYLSKEELQVCLAGNNHSVPIDNNLKEKAIYEKANTLDEYLEDLHQRKVNDLTHHYENNLIWFEQTISRRVVDFVKNNQEILSATRKGDKLYITKLPYDTEAYLDAKTDKDKAYYACHCPLARESILKDDVKISGNWCYCSAGYAKYMMDTIFEKDFKIKVLKNALDLDSVCRFEIDLSGTDYK